MEIIWSKCTQQKWLSPVWDLVHCQQATVLMVTPALSENNGATGPDDQGYGPLTARDETLAVLSCLWYSDNDGKRRQET